MSSLGQQGKRQGKKGGPKLAMVQAVLTLTRVSRGQHPHAPWPSDVHQRGWNSNLDSPELSPIFSSLSPRLQALINVQTRGRVVRCSHLHSEWCGMQSPSSADGRINKSIFIERFLGARHHSFSEQCYQEATITLILQMKK